MTSNRNLAKTKRAA